MRAYRPIRLLVFAALCLMMFTAACDDTGEASPSTEDGGPTACGPETPCGGDEVCEDGACVPLTSGDVPDASDPDTVDTDHADPPDDGCVSGLLCVAGECVVSSGGAPPTLTDCAECVATQCGFCAECPAICEPDCSLKDCGDDGCGGSCGTCAAGMACEAGQCEWMGDPLDPAVCTGNTIGKLQEYGGACCYTATNHTNNPDCYSGSANYNEGACLDAQCEEGLFCSYRTYCTRGCTIYVDGENNHTGEQQPDGIQDTLVPDDCEGAVDGPVGTEYHCVNLRAPDKDPYGICRPGTTFPECENDADCPAGESCQNLYVLGEYQARCMTMKKNSVDVGEACNFDPNQGPLVDCQGPFCYSSFGCTEFCESESDCATTTCDGGLCGGKPGWSCETDADCSGMECTPLTPYSDVSWTDDFCWPKACRIAGECGDPDWFCRPFWNGADQAEDVAFAPACRPAADPDNMAHYGEACGVEGDGTGLPPCVWSSGCINNHCSGPCRNDDDCTAPDAECLLGAEWNIDVDDDDETDVHLGIDLCIPWAHSGEITPCETNSDCPAGEHCEYRVKGSGDETLGERVWEAEYVCRANKPGQVTFGDECSWDGTAPCDAELCLVPSGSDGVPPMCTAYCQSASDCPEFVEFDGFTYKTYCTSFTVARNGTVDPVDDAFVPYCWRTSSVGSLEPCDENFKCPKPTNYCRALTIGGNPDEAVIVEHLCVDATTGLDAVPTKKVGESCESWTECLGRWCAPDGLGGGYCSELCGDDEDCSTEGGIEGLVCTEQVLMPRPDPANSGITHRCFLQQTCLPCDVDTDCGGDHICMNMGALGALVDYRCGAPCETNEDCENPDHSCVIDIGSTGAPTGKKACMPTACE